MKDAKGHGSDARGGASGPTITINKYGQRVLPSASQVPLGKLPGEARVQDSAAASALSQGAPPSKVGPAPVHPAMNTDALRFHQERANYYLRQMGRSGRASDKRHFERHDRAARHLIGG